MNLNDVPDDQGGPAMPTDRSETVTCAYPSEVGDGQPCGFAAESVVDVVRSEGDGSSTFFTLPTCLGHRLALGEHVIVFGPVPHAPDDRLAP